ncbi:Crp/Fnr family transcriptional regulator [Pseudobacter ginsenosidimutans]|uniref:CRP-like cAMP-binding protein n=1 Tax=Pseudobacter ginsenosidimutans TaxID=661488 RepID=A0A4Q7MVU3_9BACT|nr:Crp/Fnr family transcriptional regulator [Pseudobacter ginsenosidimutans]QEC40549.1 Crp/Fnr family transcriptional regulator [Pseudobacter ginsenosidimutans]RZS72738.1 CRP-like cAMP-binding protein [Pseudobacter ginsenosidimutans]
MSKEQFFFQVRNYYPVTDETEQAWSALLREKMYRKGELFVAEGQVPRKFAFICKGLAYQSYLPPEGEMIIKYFFPENRLAASVSATMTGTPSSFAITFIEDTVVLEYEFSAFRKLVDTYHDLALFYIKYLEKHWVIEKEPLEIAFRTDTAATRYQQFLQTHRHIIPRLKKYHIASYLGITPTQLSRVISGK